MRIGTEISSQYEVGNGKSQGSVIYKSVAISYYDTLCFCKCSRIHWICRCWGSVEKRKGYRQHTIRKVLSWCPAVMPTLANKGHSSPFTFILL